jgi:hypothetical protein
LSPFFFFVLNLTFFKKITICALNNLISFFDALLDAMVYDVEVPDALESLLNTKISMWTVRPWGRAVHGDDMNGPRVRKKLVGR